MGDDTMQRLVDDGLIDAVHARLMSGKEATVYVVERRGELIAAKVYKERELRAFKATADYTEGRNQTRNTRDKRAMRKGTSYGKALVEESWRDMEYRALLEAFHAGVRVPEPLFLYEDVLLMELLVDAEGAPAPRLAEFELTAEVARLLHREIYGQVRLLLASGKVHGDLSAFNILIARDGPTIIDMPQVVDAASNNQAEAILCRDLRNVTEHLARFDPGLLRFADCGVPLWHHYSRGTLERATEPEDAALHGGHQSRRQRDFQRRAERGPPPRRHGLDRPRGDQPQGNRPHANRPPPERPRDERPRGERPRDQRPRGERPRDERPRGERPREERPRGERPRDERPHGERPRDERPRGERPRDERPHGERPRDERPRGERPRDERPRPANGPHITRLPPGRGPPRGKAESPARPGSWRGPV
ncbi:MAG: hypothetical protein IT383_26880 [Deltaproteobacteria bacterium]|nr:hypothetical protein [Deltaproteobacteria bacterium]